jgi:hypothetical protein
MNFNDTQQPDTLPGPYYVSAIDDTRNTHLMAGPYALHAAALADVDKARDIAVKHDPRAWWMAWGTVRIEGSTRIGQLNKFGLLNSESAVMKTTLNKIRAHHPCESGWRKLLKHLDKTEPDDAPVSIITILDSNGLDDALWCLRAVEGHDREIRLYAVWCARQVQHLMKDKRSLDALDVAEQFASGLATRDQLERALAAARAAAWDAARDAAWAAARAAARDAARDAAWAAAWDAARDAARDAAWAAAWDAARDAAWAAQEKELRRICS